MVEDGEETEGVCCKQTFESDRTGSARTGPFTRVAATRLDATWRDALEALTRIISFATSTTSFTKCLLTLTVSASKCVSFLLFHYAES